MRDVLTGLVVVVLVAAVARLLGYDVVTPMVAGFREVVPWTADLIAAIARWVGAHT